MEAATKDLSCTQSSMRQMRLDCNGRGSYHTSDAGRQLLARSIPGYVQAMPPTQECQRKDFYEDVSWTWGDYYEELVYITYD